MISLLFAILLDAGGPGATGQNCAPHARQAASWIEDRQLIVCGEINSSMRASVLEADPELFDSVVFSSGGGDPLIAYEIADLLNEHGTQAHFAGFCGSACVTLYVAAQEVSVSETAFFLDHDSYMGRLSMMRRSGHWDQGGEELLEDAIATLERYSSANADNLPDYNFDTIAVLEPVCAGVLYDGQLRERDIRARSFASAHGAWAPSEGTLLRWREGRLTENLLGRYDVTIEQRRSGVASFPPDFEILSVSDDEVLQSRQVFDQTEVFPVCATLTGKG